MNRSNVLHHSCKSYICQLSLSTLILSSFIFAPSGVSAEQEKSFFIEGERVVLEMGRNTEVSKTVSHNAIVSASEKKENIVEERTRKLQQRKKAKELGYDLDVE